jgi:hypothetical protein
MDQRDERNGTRMISLALMLIFFYELIQSTHGEANMVNLELSEDEAKVLQNVLENYHSHLDVEIHRTYKREFRDALKEREKFLAAIIERLRKQRAQAA